MFVDTHAHIYLEDFKEDIDQVIESSLSNDVTKILLPNIDESTVDAMLTLQSNYPNICHPMMGLHPCSVTEGVDEQLAFVEERLKSGNFIAVGEIGTDLYWDKTFWEHQQIAFKYQCKLALQYDLPVAIHCRNSIDETIELVTPFAKKGLTGVFHCFTGSLEQASKIDQLGFYFGLGGVATFKNGGLDKVIPHLNKNRILLETDSPYLSPTPERGKRNEPAKIRLIAKRVAEILNLEIADLAGLTTNNSNQLFFRS